jgi:undecaprenyl-diphosphatase
MLLYILTDWLSIIPVGLVVGFALLGLLQLLRRKKLFEVDYDILVLGGFYVALIAVYVLFEMLPVNYRPLLIEGALEVSYPSSTTMLVMCIMPTAIMQLNSRIKNIRLKRVVSFILNVFTAFMVAGRLLSGVHWLSDIVGGALVSAGLVMMYKALIYIRTE